MDTRNRLAQAARRAKRRSVLDLAYRALQHVVVIDVSHLLVLDREDLHEVEALVPACYKFLSADELAECLADPKNEMCAEFLQRLRCGHDNCFAAMIEGCLAAYLWLATGSIEAVHNSGRSPRSGVAISFPSDTAFIYKAFTRPEYRGRRLYGSLLAWAARMLAPLGITRLVATAEWNNHAASQTCRQVGFRNLGRIWRIACGKRAVTTRPPGAHSLGILVGDRARVDSREIGAPDSRPAAALAPLDDHLSPLLCSSESLCKSAL